MFLGAWRVDDYLTFSISTKNPNTGEAVDADSAPLYRIYEDEITVPILTGNLALLDTANTIGLYSERIQLTASNGLERGKSYTIYIEATVGAVNYVETSFFKIKSKVSLNDIQLLIESQRGAHTGTGNIYYVDPINGASYASGARGKHYDPLLSVQDCHDNLVVDSNHDIVMLLPGASGTTVMTENVTLSKRYTFYRGPGRDFLWTRSGAGNTITITGDGIELSGFQLSTAVTGSGDGINVSGADFLAVRKVWINYTRGSGIDISNCTSVIIDRIVIDGAGQGGSGHGISITPAGGDSNHAVIKNCHIASVPGDGIRLNGASVNHSLISNNTIHDCTGTGINILADVADSFVNNNILGNNGTDISDVGTDCVFVNNEQWSTVAKIIAGITDGDLDLEEMIRIILAAVSGKTTGGGLNFRDSADTKDRIVAVTDANKNRTSITLDGS